MRLTALAQHMCFLKISCLDIIFSGHSSNERYVLYAGSMIGPRFNCHSSLTEALSGEYILSNSAMIPKTYGFKIMIKRVAKNSS